MEGCITLLVNMVIIRSTTAINVIGDGRTVVQGKDVDLSCKLMDNMEELTQITWQKRTRGSPVKENFYIILPPDNPKNVNGLLDRLQFIGSTAKTIGSIRLLNVSLLDEGTYTCIFTVFPSGPYERDITLNVMVRPATSLTQASDSVVGESEVTLATCAAAGAKPPAEVRWDTGTLKGLTGTVTNSTQNANGTTTVVSHLMGIPYRAVNQKVVKCYVNQSALDSEETMDLSLNIHYAPLSVNMSSVLKDSVLECKAEANPKPDYTWSREGKPWPVSAVRVEAGRLQFLSPTFELSGVYICAASNIYGKLTSPIYIHIVSGLCTVCWTLFGLFISICVIVTAVLVVYWHKRICLNHLYTPTKRKSETDDEEERNPAPRAQRMEIVQRAAQMDSVEEDSPT